MGSLREDDDEHNFKETELKLGLPGVTKEGLVCRTGKRTFSEAFMESGNDEKWISSSLVKPVAAFETSKHNEQGMLATPLAQKMM